MGSIANSLELTKTSWSVLRSEKQLTVIPLVSAVCSGVVMAAMGVGIFLTIRKVPATAASSTQHTTQTGSYQATPATYVVGVIGGILLSIIVTYFSAVLVSAAYSRLTGGDGDIGAAFARATSRFPQLLGWALINYTVGAVLRAVNERMGLLGRIFTRLLAFAWQVISWLAVPYIVIDGVGPITALKSSATALKKTWGENLVANVGLGIINLFVTLGAIVIFGAFALLNLWLVAIAVTLVYIAVASTILAALAGIYRTALFMYASSGTVPQGFDAQLLQGAFRTRTSRAGAL
jgi:Family of unknown function (DUF6159)